MKSACYSRQGLDPRDRPTPRFGAKLLDVLLAYPDHPRNHYRLLAVQLFERDANVIDEPARDHAQEPTGLLDGANHSSKPVDTSPSLGNTVAAVGAILEFSRMKMSPFGNPQVLPGSPSSAFTFGWVTPPQSADIKNGVLQFEVKQSGLVYLVTSTQYEGNRSGGWWEEHLTAQQLAGKGWENLGPCPWNQKESLLKRQVIVGESYRIRTNKYGPPRLIVPGPLADKNTDEVF